MVSKISKVLTVFSSENKLKQTRAEIEFNNILNTLNIEFDYIVQGIIFKDTKMYIVDFVVLHPFYTVFEIDGKYHNSKHQKESDYERDVFINKLGYKTVRFTNEEIYNSREKIRDSILKVLNKQKELNKFCNRFNKVAKIFKGSIIRVSGIRCKDKASALAN